MPTTRLAILFAALISLSACSSMSGNVVPPSGPKMENVYDQMGNPHPNVGAPLVGARSVTRAGTRPAPTAHGFHKIPNPELNLYIAPHLAGQEQMPVPGYTTVFNGYEQTHYDIQH